MKNIKKNSNIYIRMELFKKPMKKMIRRLTIEFPKKAKSYPNEFIYESEIKNSKEIRSYSFFDLFKTLFRIR